MRHACLSWSGGPLTPMLDAVNDRTQLFTLPDESVALHFRRDSIFLSCCVPHGDGVMAMIQTHDRRTSR